jgi:predicted ATPase
VARTVADRFEHGAWFVDLAALERGGDVAGAVLAAVGIRDLPGAPALDAVATALCERRLLLVLDNCEHVLGTAAQVGERLLRECPDVRVVATSREPLAIAGERVERIEPLPTTAGDSNPPAAVSLFLERAAGHGASWAQTRDLLDTVREVCVRLDGIPLAIELAAARSRAIAPAALLTHLEHRLRLLAHRGRGSTPARQRTLETAIAWSYDLLSGQEQATLRRLSVFHGGFTLAAAVAVCADIGQELDTLDRVTALVDRSVVSLQRRDGTERYRLLESIGLFAEQRLRAEREYEPTLDRHARFYLGLVRQASEQLRGSQQAAWAARLDAEQDNLTAAVGWCLDGNGDPTDGAELAATLGVHWTHRGRSNVAKRWLARALERGGDVAAATQVSAHLSSSVLAYSIGDRADERIHATEAVASARGTGDPDLLAEALSQLALTSQSSGRSEEAAALAEELRSLQAHLSTPAAQIVARLGTAQVALAAGRPDEARSDASDARDTARRAGDFHYSALSGYWLAYAWALGSSLATAREVIAEAGEDAVRGGYQMSLADNLMGQTSLALADGDIETARRLLPQTVEMLREQERWSDLGTRLYLVAAIEFERRETGRAALLLGAALRLMRRLDFQDELLLPNLANLGERLSASLGAAPFAEAVARGERLSLDEATALLSMSGLADAR